MSQGVFSARAPSNIALIKYMGKKDGVMNLPENGSISMTLNSLCSVAEISLSGSANLASTFSDRVRWVSERPQSFHELPLEVPVLDDRGISKLVRHAEKVVSATREIFPRFGLECGEIASPENREILVFRTANTFPQASGIASSASSFATITLATALACARDRNVFESTWRMDSVFREEWARISRQGSGSSCRSLEGPWVMWEDECVQVLPSQMPPMAHFVLLVSDQQKKVSSSEAHARVKTSPLWEKRPERVVQRLVNMKQALAKGDVSTVARIAWEDSWEMHSLFHTCSEPFSYWEPGSMAILQELAPWVIGAHGASSVGTGFMTPIVTMDAGPNVHVIVDATQKDLWFNRLNRLGFKILSDHQGTGAIV